MNVITIQSAKSSENNQLGILKIINGHTSSIKCLAWSPNGEKLATSSLDTRLIIWNIDSESQLYNQNTFKTVYSLCWSKKGNKLAAGCHNGKMRIINVNKCREICVYKCHEKPISSMSYLFFTDLIISVSFDKILKISDPLNKIENFKYESDAPICSLSYSSDGKIAIGTLIGSIKIFEKVNLPPKIIYENDQENTIITSLSWSPDGSMLAAGSTDNIIRIFDVNNNKLIYLLDDHTDIISCLDWSRNGKFLASGSCDKTIKIWSTLNFNLIQELKAHNNRITDIKWSKDGKLASSSINQNIIIWSKMSPREELNIANKYYEGKKHKKPDYEKAFICLKNINNKDINVYAQAQMKIADMFFYGYGIEKYLKLAYKIYLDISELPDLKHNLLQQAEFRIFQINYCCKLINDKAAIEFFKIIVKNPNLVTCDFLIEVKLKLAEYYYKNDNAQNEARTLLQTIIGDRKINLDKRRQANLLFHKFDDLGNCHLGLKQIK